MGQWQLQTAKQRFSEVIRAVESGEPQFVTKNGKEVAAIIDIADYRATHPRTKMSLAEFLLTTGPTLPYNFDELIGPRQIDPERELNL